MPLHDFQCSGCGKKILNRYQPRIEAEPPACPSSEALFQPERHKMERLWSRGYGTRPFKSFTHETPAGDHVEMDSLAKIRKYEEQSIKDWKAGVPGAQPELFRQFSQDQSNRDVNLFGKPDFKKLRKTTRCGHPIISVKEDFTEHDAAELAAENE